MRYHFFPVESGDFRLSPAEQGTCLSWSELTHEELDVLKTFWQLAKRHTWINRAPRMRPRKSGAAVLLAPMAKVSSVLGAIVQPGEPGEKWTAYRTVGGRVVLVDGDAVPPEAEAEAAVTLRKPDRGCPAPSPASHRASEVLRAFSTPSQWADWEGKGYMRCAGSASGQLYTVYHRGEAARLGLGHAVLDAQGREVCVWDARVPAEEEALGAKLAIEHREAWLLA